MEAQPVYMLTEEQMNQLAQTILDRFEEKIDYIIGKIKQVEKDEYTYQEFCDTFHCCPVTIRAWERKGIVAIRALGKKRWVRIIDNAYLEKRTIKQLTKL